MSRRPHVPTSESRQQVETFAAFGIPEWDIARVLGIDPKTLRKHYPDELATGHVQANTKVAQTLFQKAVAPELTAPSVNAAIFWLKCRAGWSEPRRNEEMGKKQVQQLEAETGHMGSDWEKLIPSVKLN